MREAVGGSLIYYLVIPIIILFITFIGFIMSYAAAYRAANYYITQIETCQGQIDNCKLANVDSINKTMKELYSYIAPDRKNIKACYIANKNGTYNTYVFRVELPVAFDIPLFGTAPIMRVKAETKSIANVPASSLNTQTYNGACK